MGCTRNKGSKARVGGNGPCIKKRGGKQLYEEQEVPCPLSGKRGTTERFNSQQGERERDGEKTKATVTYLATIYGCHVEYFTTTEHLYYLKQEEDTDTE